MAKQLGVGIIGCGGIAVAKHISGLVQDGRVEIRAICEPAQPQRAQKAIEDFGLDGCALYTQAGELLARDDVDIVHICTPNASHAPLAIEALAAGKHVLCEKPMAASVAEARRMVQAAEGAKGLLTIAANNRFRADSWRLKQLCDGGALGDIYYARAHAVRRRGVPTWGDFLSHEAQGGGPVIDIGTHALDLALWLMDNHAPRVVLGTAYNHLGKHTSPANPYGNWRAEDFTVEDSGFAMVVMENGATILLEASWALNLRDEKAGKVTLCGTRAGADMDDGLTLNGERDGYLYDEKILLEPAAIPFYTPPAQYGPALEIRCWIDAVLGLRPLVTTAAQMLVVMEIIEAVYTSAETGQPVVLGGGKP